jgi:hypothetical protein
MQAVSEWSSAADYASIYLLTQSRKQHQRSFDEQAVPLIPDRRKCGGKDNERDTISCFVCILCVPFLTKAHEAEKPKF